MKSYKEKNYEQALIEAYLKFDEILKDEKVNYFLKEQNGLNRFTDIVVDYQLDLDFNSGSLKSPTLQLNENLSTAPKSARPSSEDSSKKEVLNYENSKLQVSLNKLSEMGNNLKNEDLVAWNMGTTANILLIKNNYLYLANVGDSLAVLYKNGEAIRLNQEHKTSLQSEFTRINKSGAKVINNRIDGRLNLTRAIGNWIILPLGDLNFKNNPNLKFYDQAVTAYPEITKLKLTKDMEFIIIGCDGVWDCVDAQKLCEHISIKLKTQPDKKRSEILAELFDQIIAKTNNSNYLIIVAPLGTDNMSCILIEFINNQEI
jgi:serine/threonine protein phosphatase PrpC